MGAQEIHITYFQTPYGEMVLGGLDGELCLADWRYRRMRQRIDERISKGGGAVLKETTCPVVEQAKAQLGEYFAGQRKEFDVPLRFIGTDFQKSVWNALLAIPFGETRSYAALTKSITDEKAIRAVATANGANAISILVPCHRIIGSDGSLVGYAGGLRAKKGLLELEARDTRPMLF